MTAIHFVRHGKVHNPNNIFYARLPHFRLSEIGMEQTRLVAQHFVDTKEPVAAIYASPMLRARQSARIFSEVMNMPVEQSRLLTEVHNPYEGRPFSDLEAVDYDIYAQLPAGYEQPKEIISRLLRFVNRVRRETPTRSVIGITHGDVIIHAVLWAKQRPLEHEERKAIQPYPAHGSITTLRWVDKKSPFPQVEYREVEGVRELEEQG